MRMVGCTHCVRPDMASDHSKLLPSGIMYLTKQTPFVDTAAAVGETATGAPGITSEMISAGVDVLRRSGRLSHEMDGVDHELIREILAASLFGASGES